MADCTFLDPYKDTNYKYQEPLYRGIYIDRDNLETDKTKSIIHLIVVDNDQNEYNKLRDFILKYNLNYIIICHMNHIFLNESGKDATLIDHSADFAIFVKKIKSDCAGLKIFLLRATSKTDYDHVFIYNKNYPLSKVDGMNQEGEFWNYDSDPIENPTYQEWADANIYASGIAHTPEQKILMEAYVDRLTLGREMEQAEHIVMNLDRVFISAYETIVRTTVSIMHKIFLETFQHTVLDDGNRLKDNLTSSRLRHLAKAAFKLKKTIDFVVIFEAESDKKEEKYYYMGYYILNKNTFCNITINNTINELFAFYRDKFNNWKSYNDIPYDSTNDQNLELEDNVYNPLYHKDGPWLTKEEKQYINLVGYSWFAYTDLYKDLNSKKKGNFFQTLHENAFKNFQPKNT